MKDRDKTTFTCPWGSYAYTVLPFGLCNAPATFQRVVLSIFSNLIHDCMKVYMDNFIVYGDYLEDSLIDIEKVIDRCRETNLALSNEKCFMILTKGIVLGHHLSFAGIKVDPTKIEVIVKLAVLATKKDVRNFLGHAGYYTYLLKILPR